MQSPPLQSRRLNNKRLLLTRAQQHLPALEEKVCAQGAVAICFPCLSVEYLPHAIADGLARLANFSDVVFTSANGVRAVAETCANEGEKLASMLRNKRIAAVGSNTAAALHQYGVHVDIVPQVASQDGLIAAYSKHGLPDSLLFFRAEQGRERLTEVMENHAIRMKTVPAYRTVCPETDASEIISMLQQSEIDAVLLGSAKVARFYVQRIGSVELANRPVIAVISGQLALDACELGLKVQVVAKHASFDAMLDALGEYFEA